LVSIIPVIGKLRSYIQQEITWQREEVVAFITYGSGFGGVAT
jgi:septin family protein